MHISKFSKHWKRGKNTWGKNIKYNAKRKIYKSFSKDSFTPKVALNWVKLLLNEGICEYPNYKPL